MITRTMCFRFCLLILFGCLTGFGVARAGDSRALFDLPTLSAVQDAPHLDRTVILKLKAGVPNTRFTTHFGIHELDAVLLTAGLESRRSLFPLAPYYSGAFNKSAVDDQGFNRIYVITYAAAIDVYRMIDQITATGTVEYAEPYYTFELSYVPNDPGFGNQYALDLIDIERAWDITKGDSSIAIAVCDAGVEWTHPDLAAKIWENPGETGMDELNRDKRSNGVDDDGNGFIDDWHGWDLVGNPLTTSDWQQGRWLPDNNPAPRRVSVTGYRGYHGTWVSGCASPHTDNGTGIAGPGFMSEIMAVKCSSDSIGTGSVVAGYDGIRYAADAGARVINCSFGGTVNPAFVQSFQAIADYAYSKGALVVGASGNEATHNDRTPVFPAGLNHVLSVGATGEDDSPAGFSGYGVDVDIWAPGVNVFTTDLEGDYISNNVSGTSFASPIVSGVAALIFSEHPDWTPDQVAAQLRVTGDRIQNGSPLRYRRVNAYRAVSINGDLASGDPGNLPGVTLTSYALLTDPEGSDSILNSADDQVSVHLNLRNYLAPTKNLRIEGYANGELTIEQPVQVGTIETLADADVEITVTLDPSSNVMYSEGYLQLILRLVDGSYEDFVTLLVPVELPGWKGQFDPVAENSSLIFVGSDIVATSTRSAWAITNLQASQSSQLPFFSRNATGSSWSGLNQLNVGGSALQTPLFALEAVDQSRAWVGNGPTSGQASIFRTTNGGTSWTATSVASISPFVNGIHFWDENDGIFFGDPRNGFWGIGITSDGGATWTPLPEPLASLNSTEVGWTTGIEVVGDNAWFGTNQNRIWRSTDHGRTWTPHLTPSTNSFGIAFRNSMEGMASFRTRQGNVGSNAVAKSEDGGVTWVEVELPFSGAEPQGITAVPGTDRIYLGTQRGVFQTTDLGTTWKQMAMPLYSFGGILLDAALDSETNEIGAFGINIVTQLMTYHEQLSSSGVVTSETEKGSGNLLQFDDIRPNPADGPVSITYRLETAVNKARISIYDAVGRERLVVREGALAAGPGTAEFDPAELPSGSYFVVFELEGERYSRGIVIAR